MRESFGGAFMIKLILVFIVVYITFMGVAVNYAKVFRVKNNVINILEQNQFNIEETSERSNMYGLVDDYLVTVPYNLNGNASVGKRCSTSGGSGSNAFGYMKKYGDDNFIRMLTHNGVCIEQLGRDSNLYYRVTAYIAIEFPFFKLSFVVPVSGETKIISY